MAPVRSSLRNGYSCKGLPRRPQPRWRPRYHTGRYLCMRQSTPDLYRPFEVLHRLREVATTLEVTSKIAHVIIQAAIKEPLDCLTNPTVQRGASLLEQRLVGDLLGERVFEGVFDIAWRRLLVN